MLRRIHHYWPSVTTYFPRILVLLFKFDPIHYEMRLIKNCSNKDFNLLRWSVIKGWSFPYSIKGNKIYHVATWFYWSVCIIWSSKYSYSLNFLYGLGISHAEKTQNRQNISNPYTLKVSFLFKFMVSLWLFRNWW